MKLSDWEFSDAPVLSHSPSPSPELAVPKKNEEQRAHEPLRDEIAQLRSSIDRLTEKVDASSTTNWICIAIVGTIILVCVAFCVRASRQLSYATEVLAWSCERRRPDAPFFQQ